jgi:hypothetical protein
VALASARDLGSVEVSIHHHISYDTGNVYEEELATQQTKKKGAEAPFPNTQVLDFA